MRDIKELSSETCGNNQLNTINTKELTKKHDPYLDYYKKVDALLIARIKANLKTPD